MTNAYYLLILLVLALIGLHIALARRFRAKILGLAASLRETPKTQLPPNSVPPLVADFARRAGAATGARHRLVSFNQKAGLRLKPGGKFVAISAWQVISLGRAGFVWEARQDLGPALRLRVVDAFVDGEGYLEARLFGSVPVARAQGGDISLGEAYRYLAELPWAPDAILGNPDLTWRMTAANEAEVRLETRDGTARVTFRFDEAGDIVGMAAKERPTRDPGGAIVMREWRGRFADYADIGKRRLPTYGEVGYVYASGYEVYFRGHISDYRLLP